MHVYTDLEGVCKATVGNPLYSDGGHSSLRIPNAIRNQEIRVLDATHRGCHKVRSNTLYI